MSFIGKIANTISHKAIAIALTTGTVLGFAAVSSSKAEAADKAANHTPAAHVTMSYEEAKSTCSFGSVDALFMRTFFADKCAQAAPEHAGKPIVITPPQEQRRGDAKKPTTKKAPLPPKKPTETTEIKVIKVCQIPAGASEVEGDIRYVVIECGKHQTVDTPAKPHEFRHPHHHKHPKDDCSCEKGKDKGGDKGKGRPDDHRHDGKDGGHRDGPHDGEHTQDRDHNKTTTYSSSQFNSLTCSSSCSSNYTDISKMKYGVPTQITIGVKVGEMGITVSGLAVRNLDGSVTPLSGSLSRALDAARSGNTKAVGRSVTLSAAQLSKFFANDATGVGRIKSITPGTSAYVSVTEASNLRGEQQAYVRVTANLDGTYTVQGTEASSLRSVFRQGMDRHQYVTTTTGAVIAVPGRDRHVNDRRRPGTTAANVKMPGQPHPHQRPGSPGYTAAGVPAGHPHRNPGFVGGQPIGGGVDHPPADAPHFRAPPSLGGGVTNGLPRGDAPHFGAGTRGPNNGTRGFGGGEQRRGGDAGTRGFGGGDHGGNGGSRGSSGNGGSRGAGGNHTSLTPEEMKSYMHDLTSVQTAANRPSEAVKASFGKQAYVLVAA